MNEGTKTPKRRPMTDVRRWKTVKEAVATTGLLPQDTIESLLGKLQVAALEEVAKD